ncbi:MAG: DedA family protein [Patescibacteria group bacterium]
MNHKLDFFLLILGRFGWLGNWLFLFIALAECVPFVGGIFPGGTLIFIAGILAAQGYFHVGDVIFFAFAGALIGDYSGYFLGRWGGNWFRRKKFIKEELIAKGENFFNKYGAPSIFWGRFIGATRAIVPFVAGTTRLKPWVFFSWNLAGAIGWAFSHVLLGYFSGNIIAIIIKKWSGRLSLIIILAVAAFFIYWLIRKHHQNIWLYYIRLSQKFTIYLFSRAWFKKLAKDYPVVAEFFQTRIGQERVFGGFLGFVILIVLYVLVFILDLI